MNPRVSVVMPAHQAERTVGAAASSVLKQTFRDFELVVIDDGSTDATVEVATGHRGPIRIVQQPHQGVAAARNTGIAEARGELITFCDSDDLLLGDHLAELVQVHDRRRVGLVTANAYYLYPGGLNRSKLRYRGRFPSPQRQRMAILEQNFLSIQTLFPRRLLEEIGPFAVEKRRAEDWDFWMRAIFHGYQVALQPRPLAIISVRPDSLSSDWDAMDADVERVLDGLEHRLRLTNEELAYLRRRRAGPGPRKLGRAGDVALREGRYRDAARFYREAAALTSSERMLVWKARVMLPAPRLMGPLIRARQLRIERTLGVDEAHIR